MKTERTNMREIKFRAWDKKEKRFYEYEKDKFHLVLILHGNELRIQTGTGSSYSDLIALNGTMQNRYILMQFTGLCDKNGKEIYEGDIVKHKFWNTPRKIIFRDGAFCSLQVNFDVEDQLAQSPQLRTFKYEIDNGYWKMPDTEVIGNIAEWF